VGPHASLPGRDIRGARTAVLLESPASNPASSTGNPLPGVNWLKPVFGQGEGDGLLEGVDANEDALSPPILDEFSTKARHGTTSHDNGRSQRKAIINEFAIACMELNHSDTLNFGIRNDGGMTGIGYAPNNSWCLQDAQTVALIYPGKNVAGEEWLFDDLRPIGPFPLRNTQRKKDFLAGIKEVIPQFLLAPGCSIEDPPNGSGVGVCP
jgi:hypothetical protein